MLRQFNKFDTTIVSVMNRFAIQSAKDIGFQTILVDGLYWFWINRPSEYDLADYQLRMILPWQLEKHSNSANIYYFANLVEISNKYTSSNEKNIIKTAL